MLSQAARLWKRQLDMRWSDQRLRIVRAALENLAAAGMYLHSDSDATRSTTIIA